MASSKVMPCALSMPAAGLLPSPTMAASTMAPSIWRRRDCWAAEAAACSTRSSSASGRGSERAIRAACPPAAGRDSPDTSVAEPRQVDVGRLQDQRRLGILGQRQQQVLERDGRCDCSRANRCARSRLWPRLGDIGIDLSSSARDCGIDYSCRRSRQLPRHLLRLQARPAERAQARRTHPTHVRGSLADGGGLDTSRRPGGTRKLLSRNLIAGKRKSR